MSLTESRIAYRPFQYEWAYNAWKLQQQIHWLPEEVPLADDVNDWSNKLTVQEKNLLTQIFRFFTQADQCVCEGYIDQYMKFFKPIEVKMMLVSFANMEGIHMAAYSYLLDTVGMPEVEYSAFMQYESMREKYEYTQQFNTDTPRNTIKMLAAFGAFQEGLALFASFAMLLNFQRFNKMKGMGQIVTFSMRDEAHHVESIIQLFKVFCKENKGLLDDSLREEIYDIARETVKHEDAFIDLAFELGGIEGMTSDDIKKYIRYIADRRLLQLGNGFKTIYGVKKNPLLWLEESLNGIEHSNFFEVRSTEYSKSLTIGTWEEAFKIHDVVN